MNSTFVYRSQLNIQPQSNRSSSETALAVSVPVKMLQGEVIRKARHSFDVNATEPDVSLKADAKLMQLRLPLKDVAKSRSILVMFELNQRPMWHGVTRHLPG